MTHHCGTGYVSLHVARVSHKSHIFPHPVTVHNTVCMDVTSDFPLQVKPLFKVPHLSFLHCEQKDVSSGSLFK